MTTKNPQHQERVTREAIQYLQPDDWDVYEFYMLVSDQVINQAPMGTKDGKGIMTLRLEALESACRVYGVPPRCRADLIDGVRFFHHAREGGAKMLGHEARAERVENLMPPGCPHG